MTHPKTEPKIKKPTSSALPARPTPVPAPARERQITSSTSIIEACDRLGQKMDEFAGLFREQIEAWRQSSPPAVHPATRENAVLQGVGAPAMERASSVKETPPPAPTTQKGTTREQPQQQQPDTVANLPPPPLPQEVPETEQRPDAAATWPPGDIAPAPQPGAPADDGLVEMAQGARSLTDTLSRSGQSWPEQADGVKQALEGVMAYLENQAANAAPKVDVAGIMSRLRDLEVQLQNLQTQFNTNRLGP